MTQHTDSSKEACCAVSSKVMLCCAVSCKIVLCCAVSGKVMQNCCHVACHATSRAVLCDNQTNIWRVLIAQAHVQSVAVGNIFFQTLCNLVFCIRPGGRAAERRCCRLLKLGGLGLLQCKPQTCNDHASHITRDITMHRTLGLACGHSSSVFHSLGCGNDSNPS